MPAQWTGGIVGEMHLNRITGKMLASELGWNEKYLSQVLNSNNPPKCSQKKVTDAPGRIILKIKHDKGVYVVDVYKITPFGKEVKKRLIDLDRTQSWMIEQVSARTGLYFDSSYMNKIMRGKIRNPKIIKAIREILDIPDTSST